MARIELFFLSIRIRLLVLWAGLCAIADLLAIVFENIQGSGTLKSRLTARLIAPQGQRIIFTITRAFLPNLALKRKFITAYDNNGTVLVTRFDDVKDVLARDDDFEVVYGPRMMQITAGQNFFLGMQDSPTYTRDVSNMRLAVRRDDLPSIVQPFAANLAAALVAATNGRIDVPQDLTLRVPAQLLGTYFGTPGPSEQEMIAWTTLMFWYLFIDLNADPTLDASTLDAAAKCRVYLDGIIQNRKAQPTDVDDVLNRCVAMQQAGLPGMDDLGIRNYLIGLIIGAVPTTSKAAVQALDQLLDRPDVLAAAQSAARAGDDALLARYIFEALRFNPVNPVIYRRAVRDTVVAPHTIRAVRVPQNSMVLAANFSAMFDPLRLDKPGDFKIDRPWDHYILWGDGLHTCFGAHINQVLIPAILKPLLAQPGLRRAAGPPGQIDSGNTPFPVHLLLEFETD
jgi:cytochrome P450